MTTFKISPATLNKTRLQAHWKEEDDKKVAEKEAKGQQKKAQEAAHAAEAKRTSAKKAEEEVRLETNSCVSNLNT